MIHIAGAFEKFHILVPYIIHHKPKELCVYGGIPNCEWNGGRVNRLLKYSQNSTKVEESEISKIINIYHKLKIPVFLTFSNYDIQINENTKYLDLLSQGDGVILVNEDFRKFLRKKYPHLILIYSITGHSNDYRDFDISLEDKYDLIVPRFENVFNPEFLKVADTSKYEIMLNDTCVFGCDKWQDHFRKISETNRNTKTNPIGLDIVSLKKIQECWIKNFNPHQDSKHECMDMKTSAIQRCLRLGYKHFKISGRENSDSDFLYDLNLYLNRIRDSKIV